MSTAAYQTKASVRAGYVIHNSQRADEFPRGIRIIGLGNLFQDRKTCRTHPNQCRGQYKCQQRPDQIRQLYPPFGYGPERLYTKGRPDRLYANRQKRTPSGPRIFQETTHVSQETTRFDRVVRGRGGQPLPTNRDG